MSVVSELRNEIREMKTVQHKGIQNYAQGFVTCGSPIPNGCCN